MKPPLPLSLSLKGRGVGVRVFYDGKNSKMRVMIR